MLRFVFIFLFAAIASAAPAQESVPQQIADHRAIADRIIATFAEPGYAALSARAKEQQEVWTAFCAAPDDAGFAKLTAAFVDAVTAWSSVEILRYGPVSEDFRYERLAYWPERKNNVARGLSALLKADDVLTQESMYAKSVAVQGLPVLERLLFDEDAEQALLAGDDGAKKRCAIGQAVSGNVAALTEAIRTGWEPLRPQLLDGDEALVREAVTRFATDLLTVFQVVGDSKLDIPMGKSVEEARPKSAQWWRSGLSNVTLANNMQSAADLIAAMIGTRDDPTHTIASTEQAARLAADLPLPLADAVTDTKQRARVVLLRDSVRGARDLAGGNIAPLLGVTLGFNSLDGD